MPEVGYSHYELLRIRIIACIPRGRPFSQNVLCAAERAVCEFVSSSGLTSSSGRSSLYSVIDGKCTLGGSDPAYLHNQRVCQAVAQLKSIDFDVLTSFDDA